MRNHLVEKIIQELLTDKKDTLNKVLVCIEKPFEKNKTLRKHVCWSNKRTRGAKNILRDLIN